MMIIPSILEQTHKIEMITQIAEKQRRQLQESQAEPKPPRSIVFNPYQSGITRTDLLKPPPKGITVLDHQRLGFSRVT